MEDYFGWIRYERNGVHYTFKVRIRANNERDAIAAFKTALEETKPPETAQVSFGKFCGYASVWLERVQSIEVPGIVFAQEV